MATSPAERKAVPLQEVVKRLLSAPPTPVVKKPKKKRKITK